MRVYVDNLAVYFTYTSAIDTQIFAAPGQHTIEVMAEDKQGYISATILTANVTSQAAQTSISGIQNMPGWQSCAADFAAGLRPRRPGLRLGQSQSPNFDDDRRAVFSRNGREVCKVHHERAQRLFQRAVLQRHCRR